MYHTKNTFYFLFNKLRYAFQAVCVLLITLFSSVAFALPSGTDEGKNADIHTIWIVGDRTMVEAALNACVRFFGDGQMWSMLKVAAVLMLIMMLLTVITKRNMQAFNYFVMFVLMMCAFNIKTYVFVASYFDAKGGIGIGVAKHGQKIKDVPIGVAYPLMIFSQFSKVFAEKYDTEMQLLPELGTGLEGVLAQKQGGMMIHGTEGAFSPLKTIISLRWRFNSPRNQLILKNLQFSAEHCNWKDEFGKYADSIGTIAAISNPNQPKGSTVVYFGDTEAYQASCTTAGRIISLMMLQNVLTEENSGNWAVSPVAQDVAKRRIAASKAGTKQITSKDFVEETQKEIDSLPNMIATSVGGKEIDRSQFSAKKIAAEIERVKQALIENDSNTQPRTNNNLVSNSVWEEITGLKATSWAQKSEAINQISASTLQAEILFGNVIEKCATSEGGTSCYQAVSLMTEARTHAAIDSAGEAGMFQHYGPLAMNVLLFIYVVMTPIIAVVIMAKGIYGWKLVGAYLLFAVWVNSWLPLTMAISYYMQQSYTDKLAEVLSMISKSGEYGAIYSPTTINAILDGASDTIATASTFMATVPMLMFAILSGSAYGFVHLAQRAAMTGKDFVDESKIAPTAMDDANLGVQQAISAMTRGGPVSSTNSTDLGNAFFDNAAIHSPVKMAIDNATGVAEQYSDAISHSQQAIEDYTKGTIHLAQIQDGKAVSSGDVLQVQDGKVVGIKHVEAGETMNTVSNDGTISIYAGADGKATASVSAANTVYAKEEASVGLSTPVGGAKVAAGAEQSFTTQGTLEGSVGAGIRGQESWGTSANVSFKSGETAERAMNSTETIGSNSSIMVNGQEIDSHSVQEAMTQRIAEEQSKVASYQHSMNTMASQSARAEVSLEHFQNVGFENHRTQMEKGAEVVQHLAETHPELRESANQLSYLAESGKLQRYAEKVQELWTNPETRMAGNAALSAYFDGTNSQNIANVAQSALNAQLKAEQEIGAKHGDYDKAINVKENVVGNFENPIDPISVKADLKQQFNDSSLMQKVSHDITHKKASLGQEKYTMSEQVSDSLKARHETTDTTAAGLMVKDIATDKGENAVALKENLEKGDYKAALGSVKDLATPGGTSSMFRTPEPTATESKSGLDPATELFATLTGSSTAHADTVPLRHSHIEPQQAERQETVQPEQVVKPVEKPLSGSINSERQVERQNDDTPTANNQEPAYKPFWESGDSTVLNNAQQTQNPTADSQADKQANTSVDTTKLAADTPEQTAPQNASQFEVPEYLRQPENSGSLNGATEQATEQSLSQAAPSVKQEAIHTTQQDDMAINSTTTPQTDAWQYRQQEQYQSNAPSENKAENSVSGSLKNDIDKARDEDNEQQKQADKEEQARLQKEQEEKARQEEQRKAEEERKAEEQRRAEELKKEQEQEKATLDAMNKKLTPHTDAWAFTDTDKLKDFQEQGLVDKPNVGNDDQTIQPTENDKDGNGVVDSLDKLLKTREGGYNVVNRGEKHGYKSATRNLTDMTVKEVRQAQSGQYDFQAAGRYQIIPGTLDMAIKKLGLTGDEKFTPELQDKIFREVLVGKAGDKVKLADGKTVNVHGKLKDYLTGKSDDEDAALAAMAQEWASMPMPYDFWAKVPVKEKDEVTGKYKYVRDSKGKIVKEEKFFKAGQSYYSGSANNKAHASIDEVKQVLREMRAMNMKYHTIK